MYPAYLKIEDDSYYAELAGADKTGLFKNFSYLLTNDGYYIEEGVLKVLNKENLYTVNFISNTGFNLFGEVGYLSFKNYLLLCKGNQIVFDSLFSPKDNVSDPFVVKPVVSTSSYLKEKDVCYDGKSFSLNSTSLIPWVENANDAGIGEWISFEIENEEGIDSFLISNGYVNYDKPYLYNANNRVKKIKIDCEEIGLSIIKEINDTSQFVELGAKLPSDKCNLRFTIQEIYPGEKWNDTCINRIILVKSGEWERFFGSPLDR